MNVCTNLKQTHRHRKQIYEFARQGKRQTRMQVKKYMSTIHKRDKQQRFAVQHRYTQYL